MTEIEVGDRVTINNWTAEVVEVGRDLVVLRTTNGSQFCYGKAAIRESQITKGPQILEVSRSMPANDICEQIGIITTHLEGCKATWMYKGKVYPRPEYPNNFEAKILEYFNIKIVYKDENQLTIF